MPIRFQKFLHKHIIDAEQFSREDLDTVMRLTDAIRNRLKLGPKNSGLQNLLKDKILASLFFESSTRTRLSFETAMLRLGGQVITTVGFQFSSINKGETLYDTMKMIEAYADIAVIRHPLEGSSKDASMAVDIPIINAGDGTGQHPTQALLDLYTIHKERGIENRGKGGEKMKVAFIGDLKYGRTIHSLIRLLLHYPVELYLISPSDLNLPEMYRQDLKKKNIFFIESDDLNLSLDCDVMYITRIQEERFAERKDYERLKNSYNINKAFLEKSKKKPLIMHPLPRINELSTDVDALPNAAYFRMAEYGVNVRMSILLLILQIELESIYE